MIQSEFIYPADYETFWRLFGAGDRYANRKYAAYRQRWLARTETDQRRCKDETELMKQIRIAYLGERRKRPCDAGRVKQGRLWQGKPP